MLLPVSGSRAQQSRLAEVSGVPGWGPQCWPGCSTVSLPGVISEEWVLFDHTPRCSGFVWTQDSPRAVSPRSRLWHPVRAASQAPSLRLRSLPVHSGYCLGPSPHSKAGVCHPATHFECDRDIKGHHSFADTIFLSYFLCCPGRGTHSGLQGHPEWRAGEAPGQMLLQAPAAQGFRASTGNSAHAPCVLEPGSRGRLASVAHL